MITLVKLHVTHPVEANMVVVGKHPAITNDAGRKVSPFTPDYESLSNVLIVDAAVTYDCP